MKILTAKNGIALVAVLGILLVLTLLLPAMFGLSEAATYSSSLGSDKQRASYLARTMCEMSVAAFETVYDEVNAPADPDATAEDEAALKEKRDNLYEFLNDNGKKDTETTAKPLYMYHKDGAPKIIIERGAPGSDETTDYAYDGIVDSVSNIVYSLDAPATHAANKDGVDGYLVSTTDITGKTENAFCDQYIGSAECKIEYNDGVDYYKVNTKTQKNEPATQSQYESWLAESKTDGYWSSYQNGTNNPKYLYSYTKIDNRNVEFTATATVKGKTQTRKCILVLPTIPSEQEWVVATSVDYNQIFVDTDKATSVVGLDYEASGVDGNVVHQPMYMFSCLGNMLINKDNLKGKVKENGTEVLVDYQTYYKNLSIGEKQTHPSPDQLSLGVYPEIKTEFDYDWDFNCISGVNMQNWYKESQKNNFVGFTATNAIQVDMPLNLLLNPTRGNRLGDGLSKNVSLFKVAYFQAPQIVFNGSVTMMLQLYQPLLTNPQARRISTVLLAAPDSTPYSYERTVTKQEMKKVLFGLVSTGTATGNVEAFHSKVKAGKVFFMDDVYIWVIPYGEDGTGYNGGKWYQVNSTVWYKDKDFKIYKIANAGDVYYFNAQVQMNTMSTIEQASSITDDQMAELLSNSTGALTPFSLTAYFMETYYLDQPLNTGDGIWAGIKEDMFKKWLNINGYNYNRRTYVKDDLKYIGNIYTDPDVNKPALDKYQVIWDS